MADRSLRFLLLGEDKSASKALDKVGKKADGLHNKLTDAAGKLGGGFGIALGGGIAGIGVAMHSAIDAASDMNESLSKSQAVFGKYSSSVEAYAKDNRKNILMTNQAAIEGAASFGNLFVAMGIGQQKSAGLSTTLVGLASDLSSFNNVDTGEALQSLQSGLLGEAEPMRKFGVQLSAARIEAEAFALGLVKPTKDVHKITAANNAVAVATSNLIAVQKKHGKNSLEAKVAQDKVVHSTDLLTKAMKGQKVELTAAQKTQAAYSIIMKDTKTAQGDAARTAGGYANATRHLQKQLADSRAELGQKLLPVVLRATTGFSHLIDEFKTGTGTGGQLRDVMQETGAALDHTVVPALKWLAGHPHVFEGLVGGLVAYKTAMASAAFYTKSMAFWAPRAAAGEVAVGGAGAGAIAGVGGLGTAIAGLGLANLIGPLGAVVGAFERIKALADGLGGNIGPLLHLPEFGLGSKPKLPSGDLQKQIAGMTPAKREQFYGWYPNLRPKAPPKAPLKMSPYVTSVSPANRHAATGDVHVHINGPVYGADSKHLAKELAPHIVGAMRARQRNGAQGVTR